MSAYIVRLIENHEIVGFFAAHDRRDLFWTIDECTSPLACEYRRIASGGIMWPRCDSPKIEAIPDDDEDTDWQHGFEHIVPTCRAAEIIYSDKGWRRFTDADLKEMY